ncbi:MAG TPA: DUF1302 family protein [bacterium]
MDKKKLNILLLLFVSVVTISRAEVQGEYRGKFYSRANTDIYRDSKSEQLFEWRNKFFFEGQIHLDQYSKFILSVLSEYDLFWSEQETLYKFLPEIYEAYWTLFLKNLDFYIGKQKYSWGRADMSINDVLNPLDMRDMSTLEEEFIKIPIPMVRAIYYMGNYNLEFVWVPFYYPLKFEITDSDWGIISPTIFSTVNETYKEALESGTSPGVRKLPNQNLVNSEFGTRFSGLVRNLDYSFSYFYTWEDITALYFNPDFIDYLEESQPELSLKEKLETLNFLEVVSFYPLFTEKAIRENILSADFSTSLNNLGIRGEISFRDQFPFMDEDLRVKKKSIYLWDIGGNYMLLLDVYFNLEFIQLYIPEYEPGLLLVKKFVNLISGILRRTFFDDKLSIEYRTLYNFTLGDWSFNLLSFYQINDNWRFGAGWQHFDGPAEESIFGHLKKNKNLLVHIRYSF